jgi:CubicO group peptidase (beta-lactamase class C family)
LTGLLVSCADNTPNSKSETKSGKTAVKELNESQIKALAEKYDKRLERSDFEGVCYVTERGRTIYNKGVNYADKKKKIKNSENTVFRIASITKQFTAAAIMILQERGKLSVNDKLNKYFHDYSMHLHSSG